MTAFIMTAFIMTAATMTAGGMTNACDRKGPAPKRRPFLRVSHPAPSFLKPVSGGNQ